jgi:ribonuclease PH
MRQKRFAAVPDNVVVVGLADMAEGVPRRATYGDRPDFREAMELRPREARVGELSAFDGSAWLSCGGTSVLVGISGPTAPPRVALEKFDEAVVTVAVNRAQAIASAGSASKFIADRRRDERFASDAALSESLRQLLSAVVSLREYPRCVFHFAVHVLCDDGSVTATAMNAAMLALLDAGVSCRTTIAAASVAMVSTKAGSSQQHVLDTSSEEEAAAVATATFAHVIPAAGGGALYSRVEAPGAPLSVDELLAMDRLTRDAAATVFNFYRECLATDDVGMDPKIDSAVVADDAEDDTVVV